MQGRQPDVVNPVLTPITAEVREGQYCCFENRGNPHLSNSIIYFKDIHCN
jgi:hypothetical protein